MVKSRTIILALLILIPIASASYAPNDLNYNHKPLACFDCHNGIKVGYGYEYDEGDICSGCHTLYYRGNFKETHEPLTCKGCHGITTKESFHTKHINASCMTCHIDNTLPDNPYNECLSCHITGLHSAHIEKSCFICHADPNKIKEIIKPQKTVQVCDEEDCWNEIIPETNITNDTKLINTSKSITNYKKITIYEMLVNLYRQIRDDLI